MKLMRNLLCALTLILASCTTIETHLPQGPQGAEGKQGLSAFEFWVESVNKGEVQWDKNALTVADFFKYLKGKDGATGTSAYDQWKKEIETGNVENPHKKGEKWSANRNSVQDFFYFITGATGEKGEPGPQGERGQQGIQGPQGEQGQPGTNGRDGANGRDGTDGRDGATGRDGTNGTDGTDGTNGTNGTDGTNGLSAYELWKATAETGNLDNPHKKGEKWDKAKVSESDFWEYLRGADATAPTATEKEVTPLEITKEEEGTEEKWVVEVTTTPNSTVTFSNGKVKKTAQSNDQGVATIELDRDLRKDLHFVVNATAEGKTQSETLIVSVPKANMFFTPKYTEATNVTPDVLDHEKRVINEINQDDLVEGNQYAESGDKIPTTETAYYNDKLNILTKFNRNTLTIPVEFKGAEEVYIDGSTVSGNVTFDKETKKVIIKDLMAFGWDRVNDPIRRIQEENQQPTDIYKPAYETLKFTVRYADGTVRITEPIRILVWDISRGSVLPEE